MVKTLVIKLGTSSLYDESTQKYRLANMALIVEMVVDLRRRGYRVCLVSSGCIAAGLQVLGLKARPKRPSQTQAIAAIGQANLISLWESLFQKFDTLTAQILITRADIADRAMYVNAANTLVELLNMNTVPIVNENDTLSTYEARFGDNDTLSAITAAMISADYLFILTDVDCLYDKNPRLDPDAKPIRIVEHVSSIKTDPTMSQGSSVGTGGMRTKLTAANLATSAGIEMFICRSFNPYTVMTIITDIENAVAPEDSKALYTRFLPKGVTKDRAFWLLHGLTATGSVTLDLGAYNAVTRRNRANLLPSGVRAVSGHFQASECVDLYVEGTAEVVGRCLVNYTAIELELIKGHQSQDISRILGYSDSEYVAYRDNIAFYVDRPSTEAAAARLDHDDV